MIYLCILGLNVVHAYVCVTLSLLGVGYIHINVVRGNREGRLQSLDMIQGYDLVAPAVLPLICYSVYSYGYSQWISLGLYINTVWPGRHLNDMKVIWDFGCCVIFW